MKDLSKATAAVMAISKEEEAAAEDISRFGAPSECLGLVFRQTARHRVEAALAAGFRDYEEFEAAAVAATSYSWVRRNLGGYTSEELSTPPANGGYF